MILWFCDITLHCYSPFILPYCTPFTWIFQNTLQSFSDTQQTLLKWASLWLHLFMGRNHPLTSWHRTLVDSYKDSRFPYQKMLFWLIHSWSQSSIQGLAKWCSSNLAQDSIIKTPNHWSDLCEMNYWPYIPYFGIGSAAEEIPLYSCRYLNHCTYSMHRHHFKPICMQLCTGLEPKSNNC